MCSCNICVMSTVDRKTTRPWKFSDDPDGYDTKRLQGVAITPEQEALAAQQIHEADAEMPPTAGKFRYNLDLSESMRAAVQRVADQEQETMAVVVRRYIRWGQILERYMRSDK